MKIEIAENLIYGYLKHIEGCRIVQTNWKTSSSWTVTEYDDQRARILFEKIKNSDSFKDIFKNSSFNQLIKQAEVDVVGLNTVEKSVFGIDVAFHSLGLLYVDSNETALRVMKKIFRTIFIMQSYFSDYDKFNSYFVTPKVNPATKRLIDPLIKEAKEIIQDDSINIDFISNDEFYTKYVDPLTIEFLDDNDTVELFSRAIKLLQLDPRIKTTKMANTISKNKTEIITEKRMVDGMKIGQFVKFNMRKLFDEHLISDKDIQNFQNKEYSKRKFNLNFELLRKKGLDTFENGINRYYSKEFFCGDYYLTSQWYEYHWEHFLTWLREIKK